MNDYRVDRSKLESFSSEEILRILKHERDDYTDEALAVFEKILESRGYTPSAGASHSPARAPAASGAVPEHGGVLISGPADAVRVLNDILGNVLNGTMDPQVAGVASTIVMGILRALEQEFMTDSGEGS